MRRSGSKQIKTQGQLGLLAKALEMNSFLQVSWGVTMGLPSNKGTGTFALRLKLKRAKRSLAASTCGIIALLATTGCTFIHNSYENFRYDDTWNRAVTSTRNKAWSKTAWHKRKHLFCREKQLDNFYEGFRAGYQDVCNGSTGCTPNVPPRDYWSWQYQSAEGQRKVGAWFAGYPHGARAAEEDGIANFSQIQLSSNLQQEYRTAGVLPPSQNAVYPILPSPNGAIGSPTSAPLPVQNTHMQDRPGPATPGGPAADPPAPGFTFNQ